MSAARPRERRRSFRWKWIAATVLAVAAIFDWMRPAEHQFSVALYERAVVSPYRWLVRPLMATFVRCRYEPTCSQYSLEAVRAHGFPRGFWMTTKRLFRCMPWVPLGTHDPVPQPT